MNDDMWLARLPNVWPTPRSVELARDLRAGMPVDPQWDLANFRFRNDDGNESSGGATFKAAENVNLTGQDVDSDYEVRIRIAIDITNSGATTNADDPDIVPRLEFKIPAQSVGWTTMPASGGGTYVEMDGTDSGLADGSACTDHGVTTQYNWDNDGTQEETGSDSGTLTISTAGQNSYISEWAVILLSAGLTDGDVIYFRVTDAGTLLDTYSYGDASDTNPITITVTKADDTTLVVQDATHSLAAESPALTQAHTLVVAGATHALAAESPALTQAHTLVVAESAHGHTAEAPALTQAHTLAVAAANHAHLADAPVLTQAHTLAAASALHSHTAEAPVLTQAHTLVVADALHNHAAESPTLIESALLVVQSALHAHAAESPVLTQAHMLAVASALHAHTAESPTLVLDTATLIVQSALHAHAAAAPVLTQAHTLVAQSALHAHTADNVTLATVVELVVQSALHAHTAGEPHLQYMQRLLMSLLTRDLTLEGTTRDLSVSAVTRDMEMD